MPSFGALRFGTTNDAPRLGDEFIADVSAALDRIGDAPESYPAIAGTPAADPLIREVAVQWFPHLIGFEQHEQHLVVLAVTTPNAGHCTGSHA